MNRFYIIGSINMDMTAYVSHFPKSGETVIGEEMHQLPGGKGGNQAVALARLGAHVEMFGKIGNDQFGVAYLNILQKESVDSTHIEVVNEVSTGIALIEVERHSAQNRIIVIPGANALVDDAYIQKTADYIVSQSKKYPNDQHIVLLQLEIPLSSVIRTLAMLKAHKHITTILDPAPAPASPPENFFTYVDFITPNETETKILTGIEVHNEESALRAGQVLLSKGCKHAIIKAGKEGAYFISGFISGFESGVESDTQILFISQYTGINAVDTTAAGDSFNAGFAYALAETCATSTRNAEGIFFTDDEIKNIIQFANKVAGLSTTKDGAQAAMPSLEEISAYFDS